MDVFILKLGVVVVRYFQFNIDISQLSDSLYMGFKILTGKAQMLMFPFYVRLNNTEETTFTRFSSEFMTCLWFKNNFPSLVS